MAAAAARSELALVDRGLTEVPAEAVATHGATATTVNLTENCLVLGAFTACQTLILDKNELESLEGLPRMPSVTTLWFNNNKVSDIVDFMDQACALLPSLVYLTLMQNPASPPLMILSEEDVAKEQRFRLYVIYRLPKLQFLNASPVTAAERREAAEKGQYMAVRKPKRATSGGAGGSGSGAGDAAGAAAAAPDAASLFFGGATAGSAPAAGAGGGGAGAAAGKGEGEDGDKRPSAFIALGSTHYDGRHSEGNRFIVDSDL